MCSYTTGKKAINYSYSAEMKLKVGGLVEQVLDIQNDSPDWANFNTTENAEPSQAFPTIPSRDRTYGETRRQPRRRPIAEVRFQTALIHVIGIPEPVILVDRSGIYPNPLAS